MFAQCKYTFRAECVGAACIFTDSTALNTTQERVNTDELYPLTRHFRISDTARSIRRYAVSAFQSSEHGKRGG